jgi:hypothetical protein
VIAVEMGARSFAAGAAAWQYSLAWYSDPTVARSGAMYKPTSIAAACFALAACAAAPPGSPPNLAADASAAGAPLPATPVKTVELADLPSDELRCEDVTRRGTRIVVGQRCRPINEEALADQLHQVRREQDELDRLAREREGQRRGGGL